jgi:hypothetical protein
MHCIAILAGTPIEFGELTKPALAIPPPVSGEGRAPTNKTRRPSTIANVSGTARQKSSAPSAIFFQKAENNLTKSTTVQT